MAQVTEENLLEAIEKDDIKAFNALMENAQCGAYRLGRFPVLSMLYLYKSRKILAVHEEKFLKITNWEALREPARVAKAFSERAGKCLRLYLNEVVSPLEMLLILDRTGKLKRVYPMTRPSGAVKDRLQSIYSVKYSLSIKYEGNDIILDRRPLNRGEKKRIATICLCSFLAAAVVVATPITVLTLNPPLAEGEVTKLKHIDFTSKKTYTLKNDIIIPDDFSVEKMSCSIVGGGNKIVLGEGATLGEFSGKMSGVEIVSSGNPIFTTLTEKAVISGVTISVAADIQASESTAVIAVTNYGLIDNVTVNMSGKMSALGTGNAESTKITLSGMVLNNAIKSQSVYGIIRNCTVNFDNLSLEGETHADGVFAGMVGNNSGAVGNSTVKGTISSNTVDLAGVCSTNNGLITGIVNEANLTQTSSSDGWSPIVCGIALDNTYTVEYCENRGALSAQSTCGQVEVPPTVSVAGICYINSSDIGCCINRGSIFAEGSGMAVIGGIAAQTYTGIYYCLSSGDITVNAQSVQAGGIFGGSGIAGYAYWGTASYCISESNISVTASGESCVGGIGGIVREGRFVDNNDEFVGYYGGGVVGSFFLGSIRDIKYSGNIVGVCGAHIYESNEYYLYGSTPYYNFTDNFYLENSLPTCGATVTLSDDEKEEFEGAAENKGATAATKEEMEKTDIYKKILEMLAK